MESLNHLVVSSQVRPRRSARRVVEGTQAMAHAVALRVLRDWGMVEDASQEVYLRAFRRLGTLEQPSAFAGWLRRIVIAVALNMRRARRATLRRLDEIPDGPVPDEAETSWSDAQRQCLASGLLTLTAEERRLCDRRYYGRWSTAQLASEANVGEVTMRKRLQRIRDNLRKAIEVAEHRGDRRLPSLFATQRTGAARL